MNSTPRCDPLRRVGLDLDDPAVADRGQLVGVTLSQAGSREFGWRGFAHPDCKREPRHSSLA